MNNLFPKFQELIFSSKIIFKNRLVKNFKRMNILMFALLENDEKIHKNSGIFWIF